MLVSVYIIVPDDAEFSDDADGIKDLLCGISDGSVDGTVDIDYSD